MFCKWISSKTLAQILKNPKLKRKKICKRVVKGSVRSKQAKYGQGK